MSLPDSSSLPSSGQQLTPEQKIRAWEAKVFAIANRAAAQQLVAASRTLGRSDERSQAELRDLKSQLATLRAELGEVKGVNNELREQSQTTELADLKESIQRLRVQFQEIENRLEIVLEATTSAKADVQTISRTIDRQNWTIEFIRILVSPLDAFHSWLTKLLNQVHKLDQRDYSQVNKAENARLVERRNR